jgi:transcriptional regulator with XRE-family HTH domain
MSTKSHSPDTELCLLRSLGETIYKRRVSLALSQEQLAEKANLHRTYISDLERGRRNPSMLTLSRLAMGLGLRLVDLISDADPSSDEADCNMVAAITDALQRPSRNMAMTDGNTCLG